MFLDSGNSSDDSESEDSPEKKPEWTEKADSPPTEEQEEVKEEPREEESRIPELTQPEPECPNSPAEMPDFEKSDKPDEETPLFIESDDGSPKSRTKRPQLREPGSETPTQTPANANHSESDRVTEEPCTPPRPAKNSQETPHSSPPERIPETPGSDTDSATEDVDPPERSSAVKRKTTEQRTPEKKVRLDRKEEPKMLSPVKTSPQQAERRPEPAEKPEEHPTPKLSSPSKDLEVKSEMPALTREVQIRVEPLCSHLEYPSTATNEETMPQIGPEALVCHEVDLDDPEEKDKPSGEELLMMMKEEKAQLQPLETSDHLPHALAPVGPPRLFSPSSAPSPDESHSTKSESDATIEVDSVAESQEGLGENESTHSFDASASSSNSSNSSISLQEQDGKDRGQSKVSPYIVLDHSMLCHSSHWFC